MLGSSFFTGLEEDPFFANHREHMRRMDAMFDPFGFHQPHRNMLGVTDGRERQDVQRRAAPPERPRNNQQMQVQPFGMFGQDIFGSMFSNMRNMMADMQRGFSGIQNNAENHNMVSAGPQGHSYSQTSFMSYSNTGNGTPKVYQASSSTRCAPGGVKQVQKSVRDSESGVEKMSVGHHIHQRGHVIERSRNRRTGEEEQNQDFINIDEHEAPSFNNEFKEKVSKTRVSNARLNLEHHQRGPRGPARAERLAITPPEHHEARRHPDQEARRHPDQEARRHPDHEARRHPDHEARRHPDHEARRHLDHEARQHPDQEAQQHPDNCKRHTDTSRPVSGGSDGKRPSSAEVTRRLWADATKRNEAKRHNGTDAKRYSGGESKRHGGTDSKRVGFVDGKRISGVERRRNLHGPSKSYRDRE